MISLSSIFGLLILLEICHWIGDFVLNFHKTRSYLPIIVHSMVHSTLMLMAVIPFTDMTTALMVTLLQFCAHFLIDLLKVNMNEWFPDITNSRNRSYWIFLGFDQLLHQLVIFEMVYIIFRN